MKTLRNYLAFLFTCLAFASAFAGFAGCGLMFLSCYAGFLGADNVAWDWMGYSFAALAPLFGGWLPINKPAHLN